MKPFALACTLAVLGCRGANEPEIRGPDPIAELLAVHLAGVVSLAPEATRLAFRIRELAEVEPLGEVTPASCEEVGRRLGDTCGSASLSTGGYCSAAQATFFWAHDTPRCAARLELSGPADHGQSLVYAFDLTGTPGPPGSDTCGDGAVDPGETCDDGNRAIWDGCDSTCQVERFSGCEVMIEDEFAAAGLASIPADAWLGPRSHLMVHEDARALRPLDDACAETATVAQRVCHVLAADMPFVLECWPEVQPVDEGCAVRLRVRFRDLAPDSGVFSTRLEGLLAFTIR